VTETDDLAAALDAAAMRWPDLRRSQLLVQLALEGHRSAQRAHEERHRRRLAVLRKHSGALSGVYGPARNDRLDEVRLALRELEVEELPFRGNTAVKLAHLRSETGLKMPARCALLAAEHVGARLASFDDKLQKAALTRSLQTVGPDVRR